MIQRKIHLRPDEVAKFVEVTRQCDFDVDIAYNHYTVDAKSILGVLAMDFSRVLTVSYKGFNEALENFLMCNAVAC